MGNAKSLIPRFEKTDALSNYVSESKMDMAYYHFIGYLNDEGFVHLNSLGTQPPMNFSIVFMFKIVKQKPHCY
ncbi:MAG: hypothetical protein ACI4L1_00720 [Christensenellales bacterium]